MLGRRPAKDGVSARSIPAKVGGSGGAAASKKQKRKWQESDDEGSDDQKITKDDIEKWKEKMDEEERQEQIERERQEREERERRRKEEEREAEERRRRQEEEAKALKEAEDARRAAEEAEAEKQKQEGAISATLIAAPLVQEITVMPAGIAPGKEHLYKTSYCKRWEQGNCNFGSSCHFAHGERELRGKPPKGSPPGTLSVALPPDMPRPHSGRTLDTSVANILPPPPPPVPSVAALATAAAVTGPQVVLPPQLQRAVAGAVAPGVGGSDVGGCGGPVVVYPPGHPLARNAVGTPSAAGVADSSVAQPTPDAAAAFNLLSMLNGRAADAAGASVVYGGDGYGH